MNLFEKQPRDGAGGAGWLETYRAGGYQQITGWFHQTWFPLLAILYRVQRDVGESGGVCEIGVHHGRFFIALNGLVDSPADKSVALDVFGLQHFNIDDSGKGDRATFESHLQAFDRHKGRNVVIHEADSTLVQPQDVLALSGKRFKIVSVDGGHTAEHTLADLRLAEGILSPYGVVFLDDVLNGHWLGVIDGLTHYLRSRPLLWPLFIGPNKMLLCRMSAYPRLRALLEASHTFQKTTALCGYDVLVA